MTDVALIGGGFMAGVHAGSYGALRDRAQVRVVCALDGADAIADGLGAEVSRDWEATVTAPGIDVVDICLPTPLHRAVAERALAAGKHVLLEKPIALTLEDADAIGAAAADAGRVLMVGHVLRYMPEIVEMRRLVATGDFGRPLTASAIRLSAPPDWNDWMGDSAKSGGVLVDMMVHDFDILNALLGPARRVRATAVAGGRHVQVQIEHDGGGAVVEGSHAMPSSYPFTAGLRLLCERGVLEHRFVAGAGDEVDEAMQSVLGIHRADGDADRYHAEVDPWGAQIAHFLDCVEGGGEPRDGSFAQARAALAVALAARRAAETGEPEARSVVEATAERARADHLGAARPRPLGQRRVGGHDADRRRVIVGVEPAGDLVVGGVATAARRDRHLERPVAAGPFRPARRRAPRRRRPRRRRTLAGRRAAARSRPRGRATSRRAWSRSRCWRRRASASWPVGADPRLGPLVGEQHVVDALVVDLQAAALVGAQRGRAVERARMDPDAPRGELPAALDRPVQHPRADAAPDERGQQAERRDLHRVAVALELEEPRRRATFVRDPGLELAAVEPLHPPLPGPRQAIDPVPVRADAGVQHPRQLGRRQLRTPNLQIRVRWRRRREASGVGHLEEPGRDLDGNHAGKLQMRRPPADYGGTMTFRRSPIALLCAVVAVLAMPAAASAFPSTQQLLHGAGGGVFALAAPTDCIDPDGPPAGGPDVTPPVNTTAAAPAGWLTSDYVVALTGTDDTGVDHMQSCLDGGTAANTVPGTPITINTSGVYTLITRAVDAAGNASPWRAETVSIDLSAPSDVTDSGTVNWTPTTRQVTVSAVDPVSGVDHIEWQLDGGTIHSDVNDTVVDILGDGSHLLRTRAFDVAGNVSVWQDHTVKVDTVDPTDETAAPGGWQRAGLGITVAGNDAHSGIASVTYDLDGTGQTVPAASTTVTVNGDGDHTLTTYVTDLEPATRARRRRSRSRSTARRPTTPRRRPTRTGAAPTTRSCSAATTPGPACNGWNGASTAARSRAWRRGRRRPCPATAPTSSRRARSTPPATPPAGAART